MADEQHPGSSHRILVLLSGIASAAVVLSLYHCLTVNCYWRRTTPQEEEQIETDEHVTFSNAEQGNKILHMIPSYKYDKEDGLIGDDGMCAVCLSEFEEGEEVRTLPECVHSFHVPCIDMWLYSHTSCPLCSTDTTPPHPQSLQTTSNSGGMTSLQNVATNFSAL